MTFDEKTQLIEDLRNGTVVPYLGAGALTGVVDEDSGQPIPADSESLILAMTGGKAMSPRLMYEFPRAAMHMENKKGRSFIERFLHGVYGDSTWSESKLHKWLFDLNVPYIIDTNRDLQFQNLLSRTPHNLVVGVARIAAHPYRFDIYEYLDGQYRMTSQEQVKPSLPTLFKPLGSPSPKASFVASDADFVDYITELMGGFAIPSWIKDYRKNKQYLFLGMRFVRDTERMVMSDITYDAQSDAAGWALIPEPTEKEKRFLAKKNIRIIQEDWTSLLTTIAEHAAA